MNKPRKVDCENCESRGKGVFCELEEMELHNITENKITNQYKKGDTIFFQGNPPFGLYCVNSGKVKLCQTGNDGKESIVRIAQQGDVLGHRALFSGQNYHASAITIEDSVICFVDKKYIYKALKDYPSIALHLIERLSREMGAAEKRSSSMYQKNVRERLAELFIHLMHDYGKQEADGRVKIDIVLTREEIASLTGTANETVIRFISEFKEEGIIEQVGKTIYVVDQVKLHEFANLNF